jgi:(p)ppGpp synthase/HD superfamily hydrolase
MTHELVEKAERFAREKHAGQLRDDGRAYVEAHLAPVANAILAVAPEDHELIAAAYLHDTLEDTDTTLTELESEFGARVARIVHEVTHDGTKEEGYFFPRLASADAITLKLIDRAANIADMNAWNEQRKTKYLKKTKFWRSE